jgi:hypothetical protein
MSAPNHRCAIQDEPIAKNIAGRERQQAPAPPNDKCRPLRQTPASSSLTTAKTDEMIAIYTIATAHRGPASLRKLALFNTT